MKTLYIALCSLLFSTINAQLYFPPIGTNSWETLTIAEANYRQEGYQPLVDFLEENNSKGFILLKGGKIVIEEYFGNFTKDDNWYWASAGKTLTATIVGIAEQEGYLKINDFTHQYLGNDWTSCSTDSIKIIHQLTMTSGLDYTVEDNFCTLPECLLCLNAPGTEWFYHNAPYTILDEVIEAATNKSYNLFSKQAITDKIGMNGLWVRTGDNNLYWSTPRSMARFGLMAQAGGKWNNDQIINESYFNSMTNTSQSLNNSYGYLWWLNGKSSYRLPGSTFTFPNSLASNVPDDMFAGLGKGGQIVMVIPSLDMVVVRMGEDPDDASALVSVSLVKNMWDKIKELLPVTGTTDTDYSNFNVFPNPISSGGELTINSSKIPKNIILRAIDGRIIKTYSGDKSIRLPVLSPGFYLVESAFDLEVISKLVLVE